LEVFITEKRAGASDLYRLFKFIWSQKKAGAICYSSNSPSDKGSWITY